MTLFRNVGNFLFFYTITWGPHHCEPYVDAKSDSHAILRQNFGIPLDLVAGWRKNLFLCLYRNLEVLKEGFELVLGGEATAGPSLWLLAR